MKKSTIKNYWALLFVIFLLVTLQTQAQTDKEKELLQMEQDVASGKLSDEEMYKHIQDLMWDYSTIDIEKMRRYFNKGVAFARKKKNVEEEAALLTSMANIYSDLAVWDSVLIYLDKSLKLIEGKEYYEEEYANYEMRGVYYWELNDFENALSAFMKALEANEKEKTKKRANKQSIDEPLRADVRLFTNMAGLYSSLLNFDKSIEYIQQALKVIDDNPKVDFKTYKYHSLGNLAQLYIYTHQFDKAFPLMEESYKMAAEKNKPEDMVYALSRLVTLSQHKEDHKQALNYAKQAMQIVESANLPSYLIYKAQQDLMSTYLYMRDYNKALYYGERLLEIRDEDDLQRLGTLYVYLGMIYAAMGNLEKSSEFLEKYKMFISERSDASLHNALQEMEVKYEVEQKEQAHQAELKRKQTLQYFLIGGLALTALLIALLIYIVTLRNKRNRELAEMNATKDKFFSIISHDLKNPAIAQRDALQLLLDNSDKWDKDALTNYYGKLLKSADSQVILLYNMLNWAYLQTGKMPFVANPFNLKAALKSDIALIQNMAEQKGVTFNINIPEQTTVTGDDNMLLIVIRNLLTNAVKFTPTGGTVTLDITSSLEDRKTVRVQDRKSDLVGTAHCISISDTGIGMTPEQLQTLFCLDAKRSTPGTAGEQGSGLGLIVCKELVEKHGSTLQVESSEGKGSRFWFEI